MRVRILLVAHAVALVIGAGLPTEDWGFSRLEEALLSLDRDDVDDGSPYVPARKRDALQELEWFISGSGWSTNQFVEALFYEMTNGYERGWEALSKDEQAVRGAAAWKLRVSTVLTDLNFSSETLANCLRSVASRGGSWRVKSEIAVKISYSVVVGDRPGRFGV